MFIAGFSWGFAGGGAAWLPGGPAGGLVSGRRLCGGEAPVCTARVGPAQAASAAADSSKSAERVIVIPLLDLQANMI
ncbi:hypothetical protein EBB59_01430 [Lysobacter pythonis]|uniref:Uncharacterized protein n=1 Tax=Solilutibacter pythonis TaxID=2483112 RepID=A0A3M2I7D3_9GAMM|nr:hypothetical protein EBB59_01430 [Lysobacter pythonis]